MCQLLKDFTMERPRAAVLRPKGPIAFVLIFLPQPSYGLLIASAFKALSYETAFPLLLAATRWRGGYSRYRRSAVTSARHANVTQVRMKPNIGFSPKDRQLPGTKKALLAYCVSRNRYLDFRAGGHGSIHPEGANSL